MNNTIGRVWRGGVIAALVLSAPLQAWSAAPESRLSAIGGGVTVATVLGDAYQNYSQPAGGSLQAWMEHPMLGDGFQLHGAVGYAPFKIRGLSGYALNQWSFLAGVETSRKGFSNWVKPFASLNAGVVYSRMGYPSGASNTTTNASSLFAAQVSGGVEIPLTGKLSAQLAAPLLLIMSSQKITTLTGEFLLRWSL